MPVQWNLNRLRSEISRATSDMVHKTAENVADDARRLVPVESGDLQRSIRVADTDDGVYVVADIDYAAYVEEGTSQQAAQPFLRPALYQRREIS